MPKDRDRPANSTGKSDDMNHQPNGQPTPEQLAAIETMNRIGPILRIAIQTTIRGLLVSCPGVPPGTVLNLIAYEAANFMGQALQGDLAALAAVRKGIQAAFEEGLRKAPLIQSSNWQPPAGETIGERP